jgi:hypothetical protein
VVGFGFDDDQGFFCLFLLQFHLGYGRGYNLYLV